MPHGKCRKGKEQRKKPGGRFKSLKHMHARKRQKELTEALPDALESMRIDGRNAATHRPTRDAADPS